MGMYDYINCGYPLPGIMPDYVKGDQRKFDFQTKDTDPQLMEFHTIHEDGSFSIEDFHGELSFYDSNIRGSGPGLYTSTGEDAESVSYLAHFSYGKVVRIEQESYERKPALPSAMQIPYGMRKYTEEEKAKAARRREESMIALKVYVLYGGEEKGRWAEVVYEEGSEICLRYDEPKHRNRLSLMSKMDRDHLIWDSEEEAFAEKNARQDHWDKQKEEYDTHCERWEKERDHSAVSES